ncbi:MAG: XdhC family protein [Deltaproteobacteria bacterium]|nr:XdhC family protein [Deltaproteobacteria bacterium]MBW2478679.1 XdhC family protein [Deltaproteobacteria bacterium]
MIDRETFQKLAALKDRGIDAALATIVETSGSTPRGVGAKMIICADGTSYGTVGGGCGENEVRSAALRCLLTTQTPELVEVSLLDDLGTKGGDVCGGKMLIFVEPIPR